MPGSCREKRAVLYARVSAVQLDVWLIPLAPIADLEYLLRLLSPDERQRADRLRHPPSREAFIVAHALLRSALSQRVNVDPRRWTFAADGSGKPVIAAPRVPLRFSLSHCPALAACAVADSVDVGVDVESLATRVDAAAVARYFTPEEQQWVAGSSPPKRRAHCLKLWTLKEAYLKALGVGLSEAALATVAFDCSGSRPSVRFAGPWPDDSSAWWFDAWTHAGCAVAAAVRARRRVELRVLTPEVRHDRFSGWPELRARETGGLL